MNYYDACYSILHLKCFKIIKMLFQPAIDEIRYLQILKKLQPCLLSERKNSNSALFLKKTITDNTTYVLNLDNQVQKNYDLLYKGGNDSVYKHKWMNSVIQRLFRPTHPLLLCFLKAKHLCSFCYAKNAKTPLAFALLFKSKGARGVGKHAPPYTSVLPFVCAKAFAPRRGAQVRKEVRVTKELSYWFVLTHKLNTGVIKKQAKNVIDKYNKHKIVNFPSVKNQPNFSFFLYKKILKKYLYTNSEKIWFFLSKILTQIFSLMQNQSFFEKNLNNLNLKAVVWSMLDFIVFKLQMILFYDKLYYFKSENLFVQKTIVNSWSNQVFHYCLLFLAKAKGHLAFCLRKASRPQRGRGGALAKERGKSNSESFRQQPSKIESYEPCDDNTKFSIVLTFFKVRQFLKKLLLQQILTAQIETKIIIKNYRPSQAHFIYDCIEYLYDSFKQGPKFILKAAIWVNSLKVFQEKINNLFYEYFKPYNFSNVNLDCAIQHNNHVSPFVNRTKRPFPIQHFAYSFFKKKNKKQLCFPCFPCFGFLNPPPPPQRGRAKWQSAFKKQSVKAKFFAKQKKASYPIRSKRKKTKFKNKIKKQSLKTKLFLQNKKKAPFFYPTCSIPLGDRAKAFVWLFKPNILPFGFANTPEGRRGKTQAKVRPVASKKAKRVKSKSKCYTTSITHKFHKLFINKQLFLNSCQQNLCFHNFIFLQKKYFQFFFKKTYLVSDETRTSFFEQGKYSFSNLISNETQIPFIEKNFETFYLPNSHFTSQTSQIKTRKLKMQQISESQQKAKRNCVLSFKKNNETVVVLKNTTISFDSLFQMNLFWNMEKNSLKECFRFVFKFITKTKLQTNILSKNLLTTKIVQYHNSILFLMINPNFILNYFFIFQKWFGNHGLKLAEKTLFHSYFELKFEPKIRKTYTESLKTFCYTSQLCFYSLLLQSKAREAKQEPIKEKSDLCVSKGFCTPKGSARRILLNGNGIQCKNQTKVCFSSKPGFDFAGFYFVQSKIQNQKRNLQQKMLRNRGNINKTFYTKVLPSKYDLMNYFYVLKQIVKKSKAKSQEALIKILTPYIVAWCFHYRIISQKKILNLCDHILFKSLWRWACRKHPNKSINWVKTKYFNTKYLSSKGGVAFCCLTTKQINSTLLFHFGLKNQSKGSKGSKAKAYSNSEFRSRICLPKHQTACIIRHLRIYQHASFYDENWKYFLKRFYNT